MRSTNQTVCLRQEMFEHSLAKINKTEDKIEYKSKVLIALCGQGQ
jgi:hypothetical protein